MSQYLVNGSDLTSIANAIRTKGETSARLVFPSGFVSAINAINDGGSGGGEVIVPDGCEIGTFVTQSDDNEATITHNIGGTPKFAACFAVPDMAWGDLATNIIIGEILMSDPQTGNFDINAANGHVVNTVYISNGTSILSSNTYTTYPAAMNNSSVTFATGRYYSGKFKAGITYVYVLIA